MIGPFALNQVHCGDALEMLRRMPDECVQVCVTSPPYWGLRDYGVVGQCGLEKTPQEYVDRMTEVFEEVRRVLRTDGTLWINMGDCYASAGGAGWQGKHGARADRTRTQRNLKRKSTSYGIKRKDLIGVPWMMAFALQAAGWYLRCDIIWSKPDPMPESVTDRPTKSHEYLFLMAKSEKYYYDQEATLEPASEGTHVRLAQNVAAQVGSMRANGGAKTNGPMKAVARRMPEKVERICRESNHGRNHKQDGHGRRHEGFNERWKVKNNASFNESVCLRVPQRNKRSVWEIPTHAYSGAHFATFPPALVEPCILAGSKAGDLVMDPFAGSGTTGVVALRRGRKFIGFDLNPKYCQELSAPRLAAAEREFKAGQMTIFDMEDRKNGRG